MPFPGNYFAICLAIPTMLREESFAFVDDRHDFVKMLAVGPKYEDLIKRFLISVRQPKP